MSKIKKIKKLIIIPLLFAMLLSGCNKQAKVDDLPENDHAVSDTAYITLDWLAESGNDMAKRLLEEVGDKAIVSQKQMEIDDSIRTVNREYQKLRYDSLNEYVMQNNYGEVMDLACGYSPRGLELASKKIKYVGCDFESVIQSISQLSNGIIEPEKSEFLQYKSADITSNELMSEAAKSFEGPVCIMTEGLFMYLDEEEIRAAVHNIADILREKGGCFVTQDFSTKLFVTDVAEALYPGEGEALYATSADMYNDTSEYIMHIEFGEDSSTIIEILENEGLNIEKVALFHNGENADIPGLSPEQKERLEEVKQKEYMWVITVK